MNVVTKDEFNVNFEDFKMNIEDGAIFIHPTDTIYGLGCDATNKDSVKKLRDLKDRHKNPFSVIVPGKNWIIENCELNDSAKKWIEKLPGAYTLILKMKNKNCIAPNVNFDMDTLGVRMPAHWITDAVKKLGTPIVSTSANKAGEDFMTSPDDLNPQIEQMVDFMLFDENTHGKPSTIVDLTKDEPVIIRR